MTLKERCYPFAHMIRTGKEEGIYPYFRPVTRTWGPEVDVGDRHLIMVGSNDYLGLTHDPRVREAAIRSLSSYGTGPGGSRFLCGNMALHEVLEDRLAAFVGKKRAIVHTTGFSVNLGAIGCLLNPDDVILCDREDHYSIFEGCRSSRAKIVPFPHNDVEAASRKLAQAVQKHPDGVVILITEGVFSMSGDVAPLADFARLKKKYPNLWMYLDDAHGLGVMGPGGKGTAAHCGVTCQIDFIMGTFSKALASIGGFIASDDDDILEYMKQNSKTLIFSAALPASNVATVLACLDVLEEEPERIQRLRDITRQVREGYRRIGLAVRESETPIIPIRIGPEEKAYVFAQELFENGVFALPAVFPAVPKGQAVIRTAYMSTHEQRHIDYVLETVDRLARKHRIRSVDLPESEAFLEPCDYAAAKSCGAQ